MYYSFKKRALRKIKFIQLKKKTEKLKPYYDKLIKRKINIFDIGAGQRMLPEIISFDGISKVHLIDPNKNIEFSYNQLANYYSDIKNIFIFKVGISDKTQFLNYYESYKSTISSFALNKTKKNKYKKFYGNENKKNQIKVYSFQDFIKKFKLSKPDIVKIDVEGLEIKVLSSVLSCSSPLIVQIETNINNDLFGESFSKINNLLTKNNYYLYTLFPSYGNKKDDHETQKRSDLVNLDDIETNFVKKIILQSECYYIKKRNKYSLNDHISILAYGFISLFEEIYGKNKNRFNFKENVNLEKIYKLIKN